MSVVSLSEYSNPLGDDKYDQGIRNREAAANRSLS